MSAIATAVATSVAPNTNISGFFEAAYTSNSQGGMSFEAAMFSCSGQQVGGAFGMTNPATSASGSSSSGSGTASLGNGVDLSSLFATLFNMLEGGSSSSGTSTDASTAAAAPVDSTSGTSASNGTDSNWATNMFNDIQNMLSNFEAAATQVSPVSTTA